MAHIHLIAHVFGLNSPGTCNVIIFKDELCVVFMLGQISSGICASKLLILSQTSPAALLILSPLIPKSLSIIQGKPSLKIQNKFEPGNMDQIKKIQFI